MRAAPPRDSPPALRPRRRQLRSHLGRPRGSVSRRDRPGAWPAARTAVVLAAGRQHRRPPTDSRQALECRRLRATEDSYGSAAAGSRVRVTLARPAARIHGCRRPHAGARHRRERCDLLARQRGPVQAAALRRARSTDGGAPPQARARQRRDRRPGRVVVPEVQTGFAPISASSNRSRSIRRTSGTSPDRRRPSVCSASRWKRRI